MTTTTVGPKICEWCRWWKHVEGIDDGECHGAPPQVLLLRKPSYTTYLTPMIHNTVWPITSPSDSCAGFKQKEKEAG